MKPHAYRLVRNIHAWGGITLALLMLLSSVSGSLLIWKDEFILQSFPKANTESAISPELLAKLATAVEENFDNDNITIITFPSQEFPLLKVSLNESRYAYMDLDGNLLGEWGLLQRWEEWLYDLHHRLLLEDLGLTIIGLLGISMSILVLAGIVSFWPTRSSFKQGIWPSSASRAKLLVSHRNIGIFTAAPLLITLISGTALAFPDQVEMYLLEPFRGEDYSLDFNLGVDKISGGNSGDWLPSLERSLTKFPGASIRSVEVPKSYSPYRIISLKQAEELSSQGHSKIYIDANQGWMDLKINAQTQHLSERIYNSAYPLHTGKINSRIYKLVLTLSAILISVLSLLGIYSFIKRSRYRPQ